MIRNTSNSQLCNPSSYATSGKIYKHLPYTIDPANEKTLGFQKTPYGLCGAEGVVVYQLGNTGRYLCIFYCVPFIGSNGFYLKWKIGDGIEANETLCSEMAKDQWDIKGGIKWHSADTVADDDDSDDSDDDDSDDNDDANKEEFNCRGFMTQTDNAQMIVDVLN